MAVDFMTALRSRARSQERKARLSGRPQTQLDAAAPYTAMADTAADRLARSKALALTEKAQETQAGQFEKSLASTEAAQAANLKMEQERLAAQREMENARLAEQIRTTNLQEQIAQEAMSSDKTSSLISSGISAAGLGYQVAKGAGWLKPVADAVTTTAPSMSTGAFGAGGASQDLAMIGTEISNYLSGAPAVGASGGAGAGALSSGSAWAGTEGGLLATEAAGGAGAGAGGGSAGGAATVGGVAAPFAAFVGGALMSRAHKDKGEAEKAKIWQDWLRDYGQLHSQQVQEFQSLPNPEAREEWFTQKLASHGVYHGPMLIEHAEAQGAITPKEARRLYYLMQNPQLLPIKNQVVEIGDSGNFTIQGGGGMNQGIQNYNW